MRNYQATNSSDQSYNLKQTYLDYSSPLRPRPMGVRVI